MTSRLSILHINDCDRLGGAGRSAYRIHSTLRDLGVKSRMLVRQKVSDDDDVRVISEPNLKTLDRMAYHTFERLSLQYLFYPSSFLLVRHPWFKEADAVQIFNTHENYFAHTALPLLSRRKPVVWRLSDMWALTGHCTHSFECERWKTGCGSCPIVSDYPALRWDATALLWKIKNQVYARSKIHIVAPSVWISNIAKQSPLLNRFPIHRIPNGVDTSVFRPVDKIAARLKHGIDPEKRVILFSCHLIMNEYKGGSQLRVALEMLKERLDTRDVLLLVVGRGAEDWAEVPGFESLRLGHVADDHTMASVYSMADIFVLPTLADTFPNGVLESMACGTPPVTFDVGGCPELVRHMDTGYLAAFKDAADLANGIELLLTDDNLRQRLSQRSLEVVAAEYKREIEAERFRSLYEEIVVT